MAHLINIDVESSTDSGGKSKSKGGSTISIDDGSRETDAR